MLSLGSYDTLPDMQRMALSFFEASPYKPLGIELTRVNELIHVFLTSPKDEKITLLWCDPHPVGMLAGVAEKNIFNSHKVACELVWWIDPSHRKSRAAEELRVAYEFWAKKVGCQLCSLVDLMGNLDRYYTRKGYERRETSYIKVL